MKKVTTIEIEEKDYDILRKHLNDNAEPCLHCSMETKMSCCGCPSHKAWKQNHKEIEEAGLEEVFDAIQQYENLQKKISVLNSESDCVRKKIQEMGFDFRKIIIKI